MGGNALSACKPVRLNKEDYAQLSAACVDKLRGWYPGKRIEALGSYRDKESFGDCDVLVEADDDYDAYEAASLLDAIEVVRNGTVTSVGVLVRPEGPVREGNVFQVDLIQTSREEFEYTKNYYQWSDLGNFIGLLGHAMYCRHMHNGLYFHFRDPNAPEHLFRRILLTRDYRKTLAYLGFDPVRYDEGFDSVEDIFEFASSSDFFNTALYKPENLNASARARHNRRPLHQGFLAWCEERPNLNAFQFPEDKTAWLPRLMAHFPHFKAEFEKACEDLLAHNEKQAKLNAAKEKFNGKWVAQVTGLSGKALGDVIKRFKALFESEEAEKMFVLKSSRRTLEALVLKIQAELRTE